MKKDNEKTDVVFRKYNDGEIVALFPYVYSFAPCKKTVLSYEHIGQHSDARYNHMIRITKPANEAEYMSLLKELKSIGYNLRVIKRRIN